MDKKEQTPTDSNTETNDTPAEAAAEEADVNGHEAAREADQADKEAADEQDWPARVEALEAEREEINDRLMRKAAELQNFRRRAEEDKARVAVSSKARALAPMLDVLDDLERTLAAAEQFDDSEEKVGAAYDSLREGVELVLKKFQDTLDRLGVEPIEAVGRSFDENEHEAMMQQPAPEDTEPGTVLQELQKGYRMGDRVLRHSKVVVAADE